MYRVLFVILSAITASAAVAAPAMEAAAPVAVAPAMPVEHRLSHADADAAIEAGAEANRAADALNLARGDPKLALPGERGSFGTSDGATARAGRKVHGEMGVGFGTGGAREIYGEVNTLLGDSAAAAFTYDYSQFGRRARNR